MEFLNENKLEAIHTHIKVTKLNGEKVLRVVKADKIMEFDHDISHFWILGENGK